MRTQQYRERHPDRISAYKVRPTARERERLGASARRTRDPERAREINRRAYRSVPLAGRRHLLKGYGLTLEQYEDLAARQGRACAICKQPETARDRVGRARSLAVDHDHETGAVRGLLCHACNIALGYLDDSPERMESAAAYIRSAARRRLQVVEV